jgi:hypothetical protein
MYTMRFQKILRVWKRCSLCLPPPFLAFSHPSTTIPSGCVLTKNRRSPLPLAQARGVRRSNRSTGSICPASPVAPLRSIIKEPRHGQHSRHRPAAGAAAEARQRLAQLHVLEIVGAGLINFPGKFIGVVAAARASDPEYRMSLESVLDGDDRVAEFLAAH